MSSNQAKSSDELQVLVARLIGRLWSEPELAARFSANPREVLAEAGLPVPEGAEIVVLADSADLHHLILPPLDHPRRELIEAAIARVRARATTEVQTLRDTHEKIHFVIPAPPANLGAEAAGLREVVLAAASGIAPDAEPEPGKPDGA